MSNERYGKNITDAEYLKKVTQHAQAKIDTIREDCESSPEGDCYCSDGMKETIIDFLDGLYIYPDDIDDIFAELEF